MLVDWGSRFEIKTDFNCSLIAKVHDGSVATQGNQPVFLDFPAKSRRKRLLSLNPTRICHDHCISQEQVFCLDRRGQESATKNRSIV